MLIQELLKLKENNSMNTQQVADFVEKEFLKVTNEWTNFRNVETGNDKGKMYSIIKDKNFNNGLPVAKFRVPVVIGNNNANNSDKNFKRAFDKIWHLRNDGYFLTQPTGGKDKEDAWTYDEKTSGNIMTFYIGSSK